MRYVKSIPKADAEQTIRLKKDGWRKLKEPKNVSMAILLSLPLSFILGGITIGFAICLKPGWFDIFENDKILFVLDLKFVFIALLYLAYMFIHEMIHAICIPNVFKSDKTVWGLNGLFGFVSTEEKMSKGRFILISAMPFLILSLAAIVVCYILGVLNWYVLAFGVLNAMGSCIDFFNVLLVTFQVKNGQYIVTVGMETYYR